MSDKARGKQPESLVNEFEDVPFSRSADANTSFPAAPTSIPPFDPLTTSPTATTSPTFSTPNAQWSHGSSFSEHAAQQHRSLQLPQRISTSPRFAALSPTSPSNRSNQSTPVQEPLSATGSQSSLSPGPNSRFESKMLLPAVPRGTYSVESTAGADRGMEWNGRGSSEGYVGGGPNDSATSSRRSSAATIKMGGYDGGPATHGLGYSNQGNGGGYTYDTAMGSNSMSEPSGHNYGRTDSGRPEQSSSTSPSPYRSQPGCVLCTIVSETSSSIRNASTSTSSSYHPSSASSIEHPISSFEQHPPVPFATSTHIDPFAQERSTSASTPASADIGLYRPFGGEGEPMSRPGSTKPLMLSEASRQGSNSLLPSPGAGPSSSSSSGARDPAHSTLDASQASQPTFIQGKKILLQSSEITVWESSIATSSKTSIFGRGGGGGGKKGKGVEGGRNGTTTVGEAVASGGRHLVIVLNRHLESIYDLGPSDVPILHSTLQTAHALLDEVQEKIDQREGSGGKAKELGRRIGFVSGNLSDSAHPYAHIHVHAILGAFDLASWYRRNAVFGWLNWYELEDLIAEIRETTSNNRIKSGYGPGRRDAPINRVADAGSAHGLSNALEHTPTDTQRWPAAGADQNLVGEDGSALRSVDSGEDGPGFQDMRDKKLEEIDRLMRNMAMDKTETEQLEGFDRSDASGMV